MSQEIGGGISGDGNIMSYLTNIVTGWARLWFMGKSPDCLSCPEALVVLERVDVPQFFVPWASGAL